MIVPFLKGPEFAVGELEFFDPVHIEAVEPPEVADRAAALQAGATVVGADGVLLKAEALPAATVAADSLPYEVYAAESNQVYAIPPMNVHRASPSLPQGRIFFQLDIV